MYVSICYFAAILSITSASQQYEHCRKGQFFNQEQGQCQTCSDCPPNTYVVKSCSTSEDTNCASFIIEGSDFRQGLTSVLKSPQKKNQTTTEHKPTDVKENATECFIKARQEDILIKGLIAALVIVTLCFISYVVATKCCQRRRDVKEHAEDTNPPTVVCSDDHQRQRLCYEEPKFVIGPDGTKIPEDQYLRNPLRALTGTGRSRVLVSSNHRQCRQSRAPSDADVESVTSSNSKTSITIDF